MEREKVLVGLDGKGELMLLKNKKTGEIADVEIQSNCMLVTHQDGRIEQYYFDSIKDLLEWEDYEGPKVGYIIDPMEEDYVSVDDSGYEESDVERAKELGIWLETKEEAEKAVEKLKAWKRLKELGFRFIDWELDMKTIADGKIWFDVGINTEWDAERLLELKPEAKESLDILFSQEGD